MAKGKEGERVRLLILGLTCTCIARLHPVCFAISVATSQFLSPFARSHALQLAQAEQNADANGRPAKFRRQYSNHSVASTGSGRVASGIYGF